jgi:hypothetical protein
MRPSLDVCNDTCNMLFLCGPAHGNACTPLHTSKAENLFHMIALIWDEEPIQDVSFRMIGVCTAKDSRRFLHDMSLLYDECGWAPELRRKEL